ncbi:MAG: hypothetical protein HKM93_04430 [Desulfobacteraceae bacterium]|nr:hypothetical protein [Desulfobacteraceae bacterium]
MIRISKSTRLKPDLVIEKASTFFGKGGVGLKETERGGCCISFEGAGGYVTVSLAEDNQSTDVDVEAREWEYDAKRFLGHI